MTLPSATTTTAPITLHPPNASRDQLVVSSGQVYGFDEDRPKRMLGVNNNLLQIGRPPAAFPGDQAYDNHYNQDRNPPMRPELDEWLQKMQGHVDRGPGGLLLNNISIISTVDNFANQPPQRWFQYHNPGTGIDYNFPAWTARIKRDGCQLIFGINCVKRNFSGSPNQRADNLDADTLSGSQIRGQFGMEPIADMVEDQRLAIRYLLDNDVWVPGKKHLYELGNETDRAHVQLTPNELVER